MPAYFKTESLSAPERITFRLLQTRLIATVHAKIQNGEFTERSLAKLLGISQPQMHNVLKGARKLSVELSDRLLWTFGLTVGDLLTAEHFSAPPSRTDQTSDNTAAASPLPRKRPARESHVNNRTFRAIR